MRHIPAVILTLAVLGHAAGARADAPAPGLVHSPLEPDFGLQIHSDPPAAPPPAVLHPRLALDCTQCKVVGLTGAAVFAGGYLLTLAEYGKVMADASNEPGRGILISPIAVAAVGGAPMVVPVVGPLVTLGLVCSTDCVSDPESRRWRNWLIADTSVQAAGLALALASQLMASTRASWTVVPTAAGGSGMTLVGKF
jgi:hypothetical protein